jgi:cysteine-rich repeat protein
MKVSNFFPVKDGYFCPDDAVPEPATFKNFTSFKNRHMGIWGEFLVDVSFDTLHLADHTKSGIEFKYMNGRSAKFATTLITNAVFIGNMYEDILTPESDQCAVLGNCPGPVPVGNDVKGWFYPSNGDLGNGFTHAINLPGIGSQVQVRNSTFINYQAPIYGCSWCVAHSGGYEMEFWNVSMTNCEHIAHFKHGMGGILVDGDGTLGTGVAGGTVVPPTGQWRTNSNCTVDPTGHYTMCGGMVRKVNVAITEFTSPWWDTNIKKHYPLLIATDITEETLSDGWDKWNRDKDETRLSCLKDAGCGLYHYGSPIGAQACFEQAPKMEYSFLAEVGRRYLISWVDQNFIRTTADVQVSVTKMRSDEVMIFQFTHRPPLYPRLPLRASVAQGNVELWGELEPRLGAWSPPPNIPVYDEYYDDHGGDAETDPCASGTYVTMDYPGSCDKGGYDTTGGFLSVELDEDPDIKLLTTANSSGFNSFNRADVKLPTTIAAQGRTNEGGRIHPASGSLTWDDSIAEGSVKDYQYQAYCLTLKSEPSIDSDTMLALDECETEEGALGDSGTNLQRFKFGYDWTGDWESNFGAEEIWNNALDPNRTAWEQPLTIVLSYNPIYCIDVKNASGTGFENSQVIVNVCDDEPISQLFYYNASSKEIVSHGAKLDNLDLCLGWGHPTSSSVDVYSNVPIYLRECDGSFQWGEDFYMPTYETLPMHGSFYFDPYRNWNTRGSVQPRDVHNLTNSKDVYKVISSWPAGKSYNDYDVWNTSVMSVVIAGNSTLTISTNSCPIEGCAGSVDVTNSVANFLWSDNASWVAQNESFPCNHDPTDSHGNRMCSHEYPCGCGDVTIWDGWTVTLDMSTPFLNTLTIRGTLIVQNDIDFDIAIHANLINIKGGKLIVGNSTHPFQGPKFQLYLHGDMYFHGKECTNPYDTYVTEFGCWKQMIVNGEVSLNGKVVEEVSRTLVADALAGDNSLKLDGTVFGWESGDELIVSSSHAGGVPEYHTVDYVSDDGLTVFLTGTLAKNKIGTLAYIADEGRGLVNTTLDGRATVSHLTRNIEVRGGYDLTYDYISGVGPDLTDYGATIRLREPYKEAKDGWDDSMVGYDLYGVYSYGQGYFSNLNYVRFRGTGKQYDLEPPVREPHIVLHSSLSSFTMVGCVVTEPLTGNFFECTEVGAYQGALSSCKTKSTSKTITDTIFVGVSVEFAPESGATDTVERNVFFGGEECRTDCPTTKMVQLGGNKGTLHVVNNTAYGGFGGFTLNADCSDYASWSRNVAIGNSVGFVVESGCTSLFLEGYRNSAGITANTESISNFLMVENGMAVTPGDWTTWPDEKFNLPGDVLGGGSELALISNGTMVGRVPEVSGSVRSSNCETWSGGGAHPWSKGFKLGGTLTGFRWFTEYAYSGFAANGAYVSKQGTGYDDLKTRSIESDVVSRLGNSQTSTFQYVLDNIKFFGYSGTDSCGRSNVAISNEMAGDGEGTARAFGAHFGKATCYPISVRNSTFTDTPDYARLRFSDGPTTPEVQFGLCTVYDDGSIMGDSVYLDAGIGPYMLKASKKHEWPAEVLRDCASWASLGYPDDYDGSGTCLWWLRTYDNVQGAITDSSKRGLIETGVTGTQYSSGFCEEVFTSDSAISNNAMLCSGMEYVVLKTFIPEKKVSGSEILYGPVGYINIKDDDYGSSSFAGDDTSVDIYMDYTDPRGDQMPPQTGKETETFVPVLSRYTQPYLATLVNHGYYRIQYTGDITLFSSDFIEYQLVGLTDDPRLNDDFAVIIDIKFLKAVNLAFYYEGRQVAQSPRRDKVTLDADAGTNYFDPSSKILSFVVKGTVSPVRIRQLEVVSVGLGIVSTFESFFEDNFIDPNAIDSAFADLVPPTYAANYDPDNGNILKSNSFVSNIASVLNINPSRIRVVNIVPGNRRRLLNGDRLLEEDNELGINFEISSIDPCEDVTCVHGQCVGAGECECKSGFIGSTCNVTFVNCSLPSSNCTGPTYAPTLVPVPVPTYIPTSRPSFQPSGLPTSEPTPGPSLTFVPTAGTPFPTLLPSLQPTPFPTLLPSLNPTIVPTVKSTALGNFAELINVATTLITSANDGSLDTGYSVTDASISLPDDECGVAGGDSSTCDDACGVVNGDNSTCADTCGVPNGDGTSCIDTSGGFYSCDHAESTGVMNERQAILIRGVNMLGLYSLSFNGKTTSDISIYSSSESILEALTALDTVGTLTVSSNLTVASSGAGLSAIDIYVEFDRETGTYPYHYGRQPMVTVNTNATTGDVTFAEASRVCEGTYRTGYTFEEQQILSSSDVYDNKTTFKLMLNATGDYKGAYGITSNIAVTASSFEFSETFAAMTWYGLPDDTTYELDQSYFEVFVNGTSSWIIRFYFAPNSDGLRTTVLGDVPMLMDAVKNDDGTADGYELIIRELLKGSVPSSAMPVSATAAGAASGESDVEDAEDVEEAVVDVVEVVHVCGNAARTSAEDCDDGNLIAGDGCSANCTVEASFICSDSIGQTSVCAIPEDPTLYFDATTFGPYAEGGKAYVTVKRMGYNGTEVSVTYSVYGSTAVSSLSENDNCATNGDFDNTGGVLTFAAGVSSMDIEVDLFEDGIWEQALSTYEKFVVALVSSDGADIDSARSTTKVQIEDTDSSEFELGYCVTVEPTIVPTHVPTHEPSPRPTAADETPRPTPETPSPTLLPTPKFYGLVIEASTSAVLSGFSFNLANSSIDEYFDADQTMLFKNSLDNSVDLITDVSQIVINDVQASTRRKRSLLSSNKVTSLTVDYTLTITASLDYVESSLVTTLTDQLNACFEDVYNATTGETTSKFATSLATFSSSLGITTAFAMDSASTLTAISDSFSYTVLSSSTYSPSSFPTLQPTKKKKSSVNQGSVLIILLIVFGSFTGLAIILILVRVWQKNHIDDDEDHNDDKDHPVERKSIEITIERLPKSGFSSEVVYTI